jgi:hypothetical protein
VHQQQQPAAKASTPRSRCAGAVEIHRHPPYSLLHQPYVVHADVSLWRTCRWLWRVWSGLSGVQDRHSCHCFAASAFNVSVQQGSRRPEGLTQRHKLRICSAKVSPAGHKVPAAAALHPGRMSAQPFCTDVPQHAQVIPVFLSMQALQ